MSRLTALSLAAAFVASTAFGAGETFINPHDVKWGNAPPSLPKGAKIAVLNGDPSKAGPFTMRLMAPANYRIAPHWHSKDENLTIISGSLYLGMGEKADGKGAHSLAAGGYHYLPAKTNHYAFTKNQTVVQISGDGPFDLNYINAADNPEKMSDKGAKK